jgi:hypothetical protein
MPGRRHRQAGGTLGRAGARKIDRRRSITSTGMAKQIPAFAPEGERMDHDTFGTDARGLSFACRDVPVGRPARDCTAAAGYTDAQRSGDAEARFRRRTAGALGLGCPIVDPEAALGIALARCIDCSLCARMALFYSGHWGYCPVFPAGRQISGYR